MYNFIPTTQIRLVASILLLLLGVSAPAFACRTLDSGFSSDYRNNVSIDFNDYGAIMIDADDPICAQSAMYTLTNKVQSTLNNPDSLHGWLDGYVMALMFASAQRLGDNGWASKGLDDVLLQVESRYQPTRIKPLGGLCDNEKLSTCMDVDMAAATGYAWMAAYDYRRGRATNTLSLADTYLHTAMADVCLFDYTAFISSDRKKLCLGSADGIRAGTSVALPVNHQIENPNYGFGLMTSAASAVEGMATANHTFAWMPDERTIATALFAEMQKHVQSGTYKKDCAKPLKDSSDVWGGDYSADCADPSTGAPYDPNDYGLYEFYSNQQLPIPMPAGTPYLSNSQNTALFDVYGTQSGDYQLSFFGLGRYATYVTLGHVWAAQLPAMMPLNQNAPIGYLEQISTTGLAQGWACDKDHPTGNGDGANGGRGLPVNLYDTHGHVAVAYGNSGSEAAINQLCGSGTAHRFWAQLPDSMRGPITAYALDYTWIGFTQLTCLQNPQCSW